MDHLCKYDVVHVAPDIAFRKHVDSYRYLKLLEGYVTVTSEVVARSGGEVVV